MNKLFPLLLACVFASSSASAHPHVWVTAKAQVLFDAQGLVTGFRHIWKFDEAYSAYQIQGLAADGKIPTREQMAPLAKTTMATMPEFKFFTFAKIGVNSLDYGPASDAHYDVGPDKIVTLTYDLPLVKPIAPKPLLVLQVYDPDFFVEFNFAETDPISLVGGSNGCSSSANKPKSLEIEDYKKLSEAFFANQSPGSNFGLKLASRIIIACP